jgi:hypothetical protein
MTSANKGRVTDAAGSPALNGSNETVTIYRFATAKAMMTTASGTRMIDRDMGAGARIASGPCRALLYGEGTEAAQLHAIAARHRRDDLAENGVDDFLDIALIQVRVLFRDALHKFGLDHGRVLSRPRNAAVCHWNEGTGMPKPDAPR